MDIQSKYKPFPTQKLAHMLPHKYKLYGGAMGGGKSKWLCESIVDICMKYPGTEAIMARYHLSDFRNTTLRTLLAAIDHFPEGMWVHNETKKTITNTYNKSRITYFGLSDEEGVSKLKSMETNVFGFDEASEIPPGIADMAKTRLRYKPMGQEVPRFGLMTTNPEDCWLKNEFVIGAKEKHIVDGVEINVTINGNMVFIPSLPKDNPHLPEDYERDLRKDLPPELVKRYMDGSWDDLESSNKLISDKLIRVAIDREIKVENKPVIAVDVARFGGDETVIYYGMGNAVLDQKIKVNQSTTETAGEIIAMANKYKVRLIGVDEIGVGGGVVDQLVDAGLDVLPINVAKRSESDRYGNLRAEIWDYAKKQFEEGLVSIPNDGRLIRQLSAVHYSYRHGKLILEPKDETKKRIRQSPDRADALVMLLWTASFVNNPVGDFGRVWKSKRNLFNFGRQPINSNPYGWKDGRK